MGGYGNTVDIVDFPADFCGFSRVGFVRFMSI